MKYLLSLLLFVAIDSCCVAQCRDGRHATEAATYEQSHVPMLTREWRGPLVHATWQRPALFARQTAVHRTVHATRAFSCRVRGVVMAVTTHRHCHR
jgi:hypothetical protein